MAENLTSICKITKYERAQLLATRARKVDEGAEPLIDLEKLQEKINRVPDPIDIAKEEYFQKKFSMYVLREFPDKSIEKVEITYF